jgi:hypothetical protein
MQPKTTDLDQVRVSSMADEGGAAGAAMDAREQQPAPLELMKRRPSWPMMLSWGVLVAGCAVLSFAWFSRNRSRSAWSSLWR